MKEELKKLNKEQLEAVQHDQGPLLVVAGAGTGKTTLLINRLAYLIMEKGLKSDEIFLATFTEKAANEMVERADKILPYGYLDLWIHTFHSFAERILREHGLEIGLNTDFKLLDSTSQWVFLKKNLESLNLQYYHSAGNPNKFIKELLNHFSKLKDENVSSEDYEKFVLDMEKADELELEKFKELSYAYTQYNNLLLKNSFLDFGDLINYSIKLFRERPNILKIYKQKFKYLMIDEFQDTNFSQYELIKIMAEGRENLMVVGDDDQSIYKFRGASISNIMQFQDDYPRAKQILLTNNYRSRQEILDCAHLFIKNNNPDRLEVKLNIDKQLKSSLKSNNTREPVQAFNFLSESDELNFVSSKIMEIYEQEPETNWMDFAILSRTNSSAEKYSKELSRLNIANHFVSLKGLYSKPIILDIISYFKLLDNYKESSALYRVLNMREFKIANIDLINLGAEAKKRYISLYEILKTADQIKIIRPESVVKIKKLLALIDLHIDLAQEKKPSFVFIKFINDSGVLKNLNHEKDKETFSYLNQFYQKVKKFEEEGDNLYLKDFLESLEFELESGDSGSLKNDFADVDTVKVMTVHSAKGLEFKYVFLVDLVERRFPSDARSDKIAIHPKLIKESLSTNDNFHIQEERRLFYVALTRAKEAIFLTSAKDYGGAREKRPSAFLKEAGLELIVSDQINFQEIELLKDLRVSLDGDNKKAKKVDNYILPKHFSFSQFAAFEKCPLQYKYAHLLKIPMSGEKASLVFGRLIHDTLYNFMLPLLDDNTKELSHKKLVSYYKKFWQDGVYENIKQRDEYYNKGLKLLDNFYNNLKNQTRPEVKFLEKDFRFKFKEFLIKGKIDRVDKIGENSFEIIDYKTGKSNDKLTAEEKRQLVLYKIVAESAFAIKVDKLSYYYLESGEKLSFEANNKDIDKTEEWLINSVSEIQKKQFLPKPSPHTCPFCDFKSICEFRQK